MLKISIFCTVLFLSFKAFSDPTRISPLSPNVISIKVVNQYIGASGALLYFGEWGGGTKMHINCVMKNTVVPTENTLLIQHGGSSNESVLNFTGYDSYPGGTISGNFSFDIAVKASGGGAWEGPIYMFAAGSAPQQPFTLNMTCDGNATPS